MRNEREANAALAAQAQEDEAFRQEAMQKLAPNPAARHAVKQARHALAARSGPGLLVRTLQAIRRWR